MINTICIVALPCGFFFFVVLAIWPQQRLPCKLDFLFLYPLGSYNSYLPNFVAQTFSTIGCWNKTISIIIHISQREPQICKVPLPPQNKCRAMYLSKHKLSMFIFNNISSQDYLFPNYRDHDTVNKYFHFYWKTTVVQNKFTSTHNLPNRQIWQLQRETKKEKENYSQNTTHCSQPKGLVIQEGDFWHRK